MPFYTKLITETELLRSVEWEGHRVVTLGATFLGAQI